jgi:hypothetical protein
MAPKSDKSNGIEVANNSSRNDAKDEKTKAPLKERLITSLTNFVASTRLFIYNKEQQTMFGNTSSSWIKISIYYIFFYVCLGLFYSGMVAVFGAIVSRQSPRYLYTNNQMNIDGQVYIGLFQLKLNKQKNRFCFFRNGLSTNA